MLGRAEEPPDDGYRLLDGRPVDQSIPQTPLYFLVSLSLAFIPRLRPFSSFPRARQAMKWRRASLFARLVQTLGRDLSKRFL